MRDQDRKFYYRLQEEASKRSADRVKRKVVNYFVGRQDFDLPEQWAEKDLVLFGMLLLETVAQRTGLFTVEMTAGGVKDHKSITVASEQAKQFINDRVATAEVMRPMYEPMIIPPTPWSGPFGGG